MALSMIMLTCFLFYQQINTKIGSLSIAEYWKLDVMAAEFIKSCCRGCFYGGTEKHNCEFGFF